MTTRTASTAGWRISASTAQRKHRLAAEQPILLGHAAAEALAFAGGDDEGGDGHGGGARALALSAKGFSCIGAPSHEPC